MTELVSIIIVNYNTSQLVADCVSSIVTKVKGVNYEIIVVDNASSEEDKSLLRGVSGIKLLELETNIGFGKANNAAAKMALGDILFLLNPDTILVNDAVTYLYNYLQNHPKTGICGGNLFGADMLPTHSFHRMPPSFMSELDFATGKLYRHLRYGRNSQFNTTSHPFSVAMITGADLMIRRDVWNRLKGFDPDFFMYYEDADICFRCRKLGFDVVSVPNASIQHLEGHSFMEREDRIRRILMGRFVFFSHHYTPFYNLLCDVMNIASLWTVSCTYQLLGRKKQSQKYALRLNIYRELYNKKKFYHAVVQL